MDANRLFKMDRNIRVVALLIAAILIAAQSWAAQSPADFETAADAYRQRNYTAAFRQFLPLAEQGDSRSQMVIALMYKYGEGVDQDEAESFKWYARAADQGHAPAQFLLGEMYARGTGVEMDMQQAIVWLSKAADAGFAKAAEKLAELEAIPESIRSGRDEPVPWSRAWNLGLPDEIRYDGTVSSPPKDDRNIPSTDNSKS